MFRFFWAQRNHPVAYNAPLCHPHPAPVETRFIASQSTNPTNQPHRYWISLIPNQGISPKPIPLSTSPIGRIPPTTATINQQLRPKIRLPLKPRVYTRGYSYSIPSELSQNKQRFILIMMHWQYQPPKHLQPKKPLLGFGVKREQSTHPYTPPRRGKRAAIKTSTHPTASNLTVKQLPPARKHRGFATPSPSWVLFEAEEATTSSCKVRSSNARSNLYRKKTPHAEVCKLSHDSLSLFRFFGHKEMKRKKMK